MSKVSNEHPHKPLWNQRRKDRAKLCEWRTKPQNESRSPPVDTHRHAFVMLPDSRIRTHGRIRTPEHRNLRNAGRSRNFWQSRPL